MKNYYSNEDMMIGIETIIDQLDSDKWTPDVIVGILRGGIIPAVYLSHRLGNIPLLSMDWSTRDIVVGKNVPAELEGYLFSDSKILLVDDICDSGLTMKEIIDQFEEIYFENKLTELGITNIRSAVLHYNTGQILHHPNYFHVSMDKNKNNNWIVYPWEI